MTNKPARLLLATAMTLAIGTAASSVAFAQTADRAADRVVIDDNDNDFDFGWLGLIGLLGLTGLKRREVHTTHTTNQPNR